MAQITEEQLFEMLGRLYAEVKLLSAENQRLTQALAQKEGR